MLVGVMVLAIFAGTNRGSWGLQFALVAVYGVIAIGAAFLHLRSANPTPADCTPSYR